MGCLLAQQVNLESTEARKVTVKALTTPVPLRLLSNKSLVLLGWMWQWQALDTLAKSCHIKGSVLLVLGASYAK